MTCIKEKANAVLLSASTALTYAPCSMRILTISAYPVRKLRNGTQIICIYCANVYFTVSSREHQGCFTIVSHSVNIGTYLDKKLHNFLMSCRREKWSFPQCISQLTFYATKMRLSSDILKHISKYIHQHINHILI